MYKSLDYNSLIFSMLLVSVPYSVYATLEQGVTVNDLIYAWGI